MVEILILSLVQGITEFIPVSSSSHLIIISEHLNFDNQNLTIDLSLHIGSFIAVLVYFKEDIINFIKNKELFFKIILASFPTMIVGFILVKFQLIHYLRNPEIIAWTTIIFGLLLFFSDKSKITNNLKTNFNLKSALFIGLLQVFSLVPGVSRSGITISAARFLKFERVDSVKISFLLSIPTLAAVSLYNSINLYQGDNLDFSLLNLLAIILSFIISYLTIKYFIKYTRNFNFNIFVFYKIAIGLIILYLA